MLHCREREGSDTGRGFVWQGGRPQSWSVGLWIRIAVPAQQAGL